MRTLVIEVNGLHIGFLGCYGNEWIATPNLDRLAAEGVVFDQHIHHEPGSSARDRSWEQTKPITSGDLAHFGRDVLDAWRSSPNESLWIDGPSLAPPWNLPEDLRTIYFDENESAAPWLDPPVEVVGDLTIAEVLELQNSYAAMVTWFDAQLGVILDQLRSASEGDTALVCLTARAGLPLGEHGVVGPARAWLHEELVHVPLVMRFPSGRFAGLRVGALTQPLDVVPTLAAFAQRPVALGAGHDLLPLCEGNIKSVRQQVCSYCQVGESCEGSLRTPHWAYLLPIRVPEGDAPRGPLLFVKPDDRWEVNDVRQHHPELTEEMDGTLRTALVCREAERAESS